MKKPCFIMFISATMTVTIATAGTQVLIEHQGATDPVQEGWRKMGSKFSKFGPVTGDRGRDAWQTLGLGFPARCDTGGRFSEVVLTKVDWVLSATLRILTGPNVGMMIRTGSEEIRLGFDQQADGDPVVSLSRGTSMIPIFAYEGGGDGYHDYRLEYAAGTGLVSLRVDGQIRNSGIHGSPVSAPLVVAWGTLNQGGVGRANWSHVSLEIVPEPSPAVLLALGGTWLLLARRKRWTRKRADRFLRAHVM